MLTTIESRWKAAAARTWRHALEQPPPHLWPLLLGNPRHVEPVLPTGAARTPIVAVRVNHGTWQAECPFCPSAQHASSSDPLFYCADCMNAANDHRTLPVKWPKDPAAIEAALARRPLPAHRNWIPGETPRDLERQEKEWTSG